MFPGLKYNGTVTTCTYPTHPSSRAATSTFLALPCSCLAAFVSATIQRVHLSRPQELLQPWSWRTKQPRASHSNGKHHHGSLRLRVQVSKSSWGSAWSHWMAPFINAARQLHWGAKEALLLTAEAGIPSIVPGPSSSSQSPRPQSNTSLSCSLPKPPSCIYKRCHPAGPWSPKSSQRLALDLGGLSGQGPAVVIEWEELPWWQKNQQVSPASCQCLPAKDQDPTSAKVRSIVFIGNLVWIGFM